MTDLAVIPPSAEYLDATRDSVAAPPPRGGLLELLAVLRQLHDSEADVDGALRLVVEKARELLGTDLSWGGTVRDGWLTMAHTSGTRSGALMSLPSTPLAASLSGAALQRQHTLVVSDYPRYRGATTSQIRRAFLAEGLVSVMVAPMFCGDRLVGFVNVGNRRRTRFGDLHSSLLSTLAAQASVALLNASLRADLRTRNALLDESLSIHRLLTSSALHGRGPVGLLEDLERIVDRKVELVPGAERPSQLDARCDAVPILAGDEVLGWLSVDGTDLSSLQAHAMRHAASALALELLDRRAAQDAERRLRAELLEELIDGASAPRPGTALRAGRLGHDIDVPICVAAIEGLDGRMRDRVPRAVCELLDEDSAASREPARLTYNVGERTIVAIPATAEDGVVAAAGLHRRLGLRGLRVAIGISRPSTDARAARDEAVACLTLALQAAEPVMVDGARIGPLRFMLDAPDWTHAMTDVRRCLGPLLAAEGRHRAPLLETTRAYVEADGHQQLVATRCEIHLNTLKYRLTRIEQLLGYSLRDTDRRFELRLAFALLDLLDTVGLDGLVHEAETNASAA